MALASGMDADEKGHGRRTEVPRSREWYGRLARVLGGQRPPWARVLDGPDPESIFHALP
ncbi:hypothetical protein [Deinococcus sp.]|uniref:hypothetical protein n=1 Tax=Deinococcus sp. TaxID=47478 RepID=UPI002869B94A|nr:hypothetical protein [Deinococcus sp.]